MDDMECPRCNAKLYGGTRFCPTCGLLVEELVQQAEEELAEQKREEQERAAQERADQERAEREHASTEATTQETEVLAANDAVDASAVIPEDTGSNDANAEGEASSTMVFEHDRVLGTESEAAEPQPGKQPDEAVQPREEPVSMDSEPSAEAGKEPATTASEPPAEPEEPAATAPAQSATPEPSVQSEEAPSASKSPAKPFLVRHATLGVVVAVLLVIVLVVVGVWQVRTAEAARKEQERIEAEERALKTPQVVAVSISIPDFDEAHASPIPLKVSGAEKSGKQVEEIRLVTPSSAQLELLPGVYEISVAGTPATEDGKLYKGSIDSFTVEIEPVQDAEEQKVGYRTPSFAFDQLAPENVSDSDIEALTYWMQTAGVKNAQTYVDAVSDLRQEALDRLEEEQRERDEEERQRTEELNREIERSQADAAKRQQEAAGQSENGASNTSDGSGRTVRSNNYSDYNGGSNNGAGYDYE